MKEELQALIVALEVAASAPEGDLAEALLARARPLDALDEVQLSRLVGIAHTAVREAADEDDAARLFVTLLDTPEDEEIDFEEDEEIEVEDDD
jgi:hypothetical protein